MNQGQTLLIVDDSELDRGSLVQALSKKGGFEILQAGNSKECLRTIHARKVDLVLMDIMMPGTSGLQMLKIIREKFNPIELPIIMVTAKTETADVISALQLGASDYVTKPVNFEIAISRISTHLKLAITSKKMAKLQEIAALNAMITTYHHEINNPLTIAIGCMNKKNWSAVGNGEKIKKSLWRIADIIKKIRVVTEKQEVEFESYGRNGKMVKVR